MLLAALAVSLEALVIIVIGRSCSECCGFDSLCRLGSFLRFYYRPMMSSPSCAMWNNVARLLSVLKLWLIPKTSVMSENDDITVRQTMAHTIQLWPHELSTHVVHAFRGERNNNPMCLSQAAALVALAYTTQQQRDPVDEYIILIRAK